MQFEQVKQEIINRKKKDFVQKITYFMQKKRYFKVRNVLQKRI